MEQNPLCINKINFDRLISIIYKLILKISVNKKNCVQNESSHFE